MHKFHLASVKSLFLLGLLSLSNLVIAACDDAHYQDFDFWLGKWQVTTPKGKLAGYNTIEKKHANCVLTESYHTDTGFSGQSLNICNKNTGNGHQTWADNSGTLLLLDGAWKVTVWY